LLALADQQPTGKYRMTHSNVIQFNSPAIDDLSQVLKQGAQQLLAKAVEVKKVA